MKINTFLSLTMLFAASSQTAMGKPLFIGDSLTYTLAKNYSQKAPVDAKYKVGSGLNNNILNWQNYAEQVDFENYDTVFVVMGTNDPITANQKGEYQHRARVFIRTLKRKNDKVVWLLPPTLKNQRNNALLANTRNALMEAAEQENIAWVDMRAALGTEYIQYLDGQQIRTHDGIHLTDAGARLTLRTLNVIQ
ncbi:GDSL-type esterase/lipase family protein [Xenorhabdus sp. TH1]|uniref:DUF459 domain-containing protein n=1 Tax=Xenorhabdus sp. TH1 TaxID=3130166 RepID=UPI0030D00F3D